MDKYVIIISPMNCIVLQPKASQLACDNFIKTVVNGVKKETVYDNIDDYDRKYIERLNLGNELRVWGVMEHNSSKFRKMGRGDLVLFTANNVIEAYGRIVYSFNCPILAGFLWGQDEYETWSNIYIIEDFHNAVDLSVKALNKALGYQENNVVQGFMVIDDRRRINGFLRDFDYTNGILTIRDPKKTTTSLISILDLLDKSSGLAFEEIQKETGVSKEELEPLLKGGIVGKLFRLESGKYYTA